jgi:D-cysteine desulfhydrase
MAELAAEEARRGRRAYVIPEGGSNALGSLGYVEAARELATQLAALGPPRETSVVYACGSGGTGAGLVLGQKLLAEELGRPPFRPVGFAVCDDRDYFVNRIVEICGAAQALLSAPLSVSRADVDIDDRYVGLGYAKSRPEELRVLRAVAVDEGVVLDPVYTGKAFYGLLNEVTANRAAFGERIVFLHTGGLFGLFGQTDEIVGLFGDSTPAR